MIAIDLTGKRFGKLVALSKHIEDKGYQGPIRYDAIQYLENSGTTIA